MVGAWKPGRRARRWVLLVAGLLSTGSSRVLAQRPLDLAALLDRNARAMGGRKRLDSLRSVVTLRTPTSLTSLKVPHFVLVEGYDSAGRITYAEGYDGQAAWEQGRTDLRRRVVSGRAEVALRRVVQWPNNVLPLYRVGEYGGQLELEGMEASEADSVYRVRLTLPDGFQRWYFVNARTFRIDRARDTRELHANDGQIRVIETLFTDYRNVEGYWFPFTVLERDGQTGERLFGRTVLGIWANVSLPDSLFGVSSRSEWQRLAAFRAKVGTLD